MARADQRRVRVEGQIEGGHRVVEAASDRFERVSEPRDEAVRVPMIDEIVTVFETESDRPSGRHDQRERVVGVIETALPDDVVQARLFALLVLGAEVLQHVEHIEQHRMAGFLLQSGQPDVVVGHQCDARVLTAAQEFSYRLVGSERGSYGHGVEEQPDHRVEARDLGRPARHRGAERDIGDTENA